MAAWGASPFSQGPRAGRTRAREERLAPFALVYHFARCFQMCTASYQKFKSKIADPGAFNSCDD